MKLWEGAQNKLYSPVLPETYKRTMLFNENYISFSLTVEFFHKQYCTRKNNEGIKL